MKKIILASSSPRRKEILEGIGLDFEVMSSSVTEEIRDDELPEQIVMGLAFQKAIDISSKLDENNIIIAADTIVYKDKILGKPNNYEDAFNMLFTLQGSYHYVYTGIAIIETKSYKKFVTYERTKVKFKELSEDRIKRYIETGEVWDKAGAYAIQSLGGLFVEFIIGDYFNVVGLPISKLDDILARHYNISIV